MLRRVPAARTRGWAWTPLLGLCLALSWVAGTQALGADSGPTAGYATPTFFTATAMIGMIALAGIVVRNSIILIDFIHLSQERGLIGLNLLPSTFTKWCPMM